jgi:metal-responsive CopG/Arc/MetJ family transcriptional regulator
MRTRTNIILEESILKRIDTLAGEKHKRAAVIETALREYLEREEAKLPPVDLDAEVVSDKATSRSR